MANDKELAAGLGTAFRGSAARANDVSADKCDAQFVSKEVCRFMSKPTSQACMALKRICRFYNGSPRLIYRFPRQPAEPVDVYTDTDWAG